MKNQKHQKKKKFVTRKQFESVKQDFNARLAKISPYIQELNEVLKSIENSLGNFTPHNQHETPAPSFNVNKDVYRPAPDSYAIPIHPPTNNLFPNSSLELATNTSNNLDGTQSILPMQQLVDEKRFVTPQKSKRKPSKTPHLDSTFNRFTKLTPIPLNTSFQTPHYTNTPDKKSTSEPSYNKTQRSSPAVTNSRSAPSSPLKISKKTRPQVVVSSEPEKNQNIPSKNQNLHPLKIVPGNLSYSNMVTKETGEASKSVCQKINTNERSEPPSSIVPNQRHGVGDITVSIVTDSMGGGLRYNETNAEAKQMGMMKSVKIMPHKFPGADTEQLKCYTKFNVKREQSHGLVLLGGINDILKDMREERCSDREIADNLIKTGLEAKQESVINIYISGIIMPRDRRRRERVLKVNAILRELCSFYNFNFINQSNILVQHLGRDGLHLNCQGTDILRKNILRALC